MATEESSWSYFQTNTTEFPEVATNSNTGAEGVNVGLAAGLGICALLVVLLLIALFLILYEKHFGKKEVTQNENQSVGPAVPKRPQEYTDANSNNPEEFGNLRRDQSTVSYNYVTPEPVRVAMVPTRVPPRVKTQRDGDEYYSVIPDQSPSASPVGKHSEDSYYLPVIEDGKTHTPKPDGREHPYYMQVEEGEKTIYVNGEVDAKKGNSGDHTYKNIPSITLSDPDSTPTRQDSQNDYYSKVYTLTPEVPGVSESASKSDNNGGYNSDATSEGSEDYCFPPDDRESRPSGKTKNKEHHQCPESGEKELDSKRKGKKSVLYMNFRK